MTLVEIDLRVGGAWRSVMIAHGGHEVGVHGEYREVVPNERIVAAESRPAWGVMLMVNINPPRRPLPVTP